MLRKRQSGAGFDVHLVIPVGLGMRVDVVTGHMDGVEKEIQAEGDEPPPRSYSPLGRVRVRLAVGVPLTDLAVSTVDDGVATLVLGDSLRVIDRLLLGVVARGIALVALASHCPGAVGALHNVLVGHGLRKSRN